MSANSFQSSFMTSSTGNILPDDITTLSKHTFSALGDNFKVSLESSVVNNVVDRLPLVNFMKDPKGAAEDIKAQVKEYLIQKIISEAMEDPAGHNFLYFLSAVGVSAEDLLNGYVSMKEVGEIIYEKIDNLIDEVVPYCETIPTRYFQDFNSYTQSLCAYLGFKVTSAPATLIESTTYWQSYYTLPLPDLLGLLKKGMKDNQASAKSDAEKDLDMSLEKVQSVIDSIKDWYEKNISFIFEDIIQILSTYWNDPEKLKKELDKFLNFAEKNTFGQLGRYADEAGEMIEVAIDNVGKQIGKALAEVINKLEQDAARFVEEKLAKIAANAISTAKSAIAEAANMLISTLGPAGKIAAVAIKAGIKAIPFPDI